ncbi:MAG: ribonuclease HII [Gammaproteobacteria bacterium]|nr:ribonuclease HII [Gammaproteobacteria bacterium]MCP5202018.1 ribonuclease HII [Gammaproteobacteria bacterium]
MRPAADGDELVVGVDEAGRGPLAGPVVAAAVVLGAVPIAGLGDSKAKTERQREQLFECIVRDAHAWGLGLAEVDEIDRLNIHHATLLAMQRAVAALPCRPARALIDGKFCPQLGCAAIAIVGGDASEPAIGAASILAKVRRDRIMLDLHRRYPQYGFDRHKGYPTRQHLAALHAAGVSPVHRRSYAPVRRVLAERTAP